MQGHPEVSNVAEKPRQNGERRFTTRLLTSAAWAIPFVSVCVFSYKPRPRPTLAFLPRLFSSYVTARKIRSRTRFLSVSLKIYLCIVSWPRRRDRSPYLTCADPKNQCNPDGCHLVLCLCVISVQVQTSQKRWRLGCAIPVSCCLSSIESSTRDRVHATPLAFFNISVLVQRWRTSRTLSGVHQGCAPI